MEGHTTVKKSGIPRCWDVFGCLVRFPLVGCGHWKVHRHVQVVLLPRGHFYSAVIIMRDIMRGDYTRDDAPHYARLNLTVTTDVCSIGWLSRAMMCVDKGGVVEQA